MNGQNQFFIFCNCVAIGFIGGLLYEIFSVFRAIFGCRKGKNKILGGCIDCLFCIIFAFFCVFLSYLLHFPEIRVYMYIGYVIGGIIYLKTLRRIVAILKKVCYNVVIKTAKIGKKQEKTLEKEVEIDL
ncbi:MAG: hypothetical protein E7366_03630 [Clostridiales bacterium]|nr:hypothetical protein [Clostridiales bacterium]